MKRVLSIVAWHPNHKKAPDPPPGPDGNRALNLILAKLQSAPSTITHVVSKASHVRDIALELGSATEPYDLVQIIGHGSPGRVLLGHYWNQPERDEGLGHSVLDSSPASYGVLNETLAMAPTVLLLGCSVGSPAPSAFVARARALLFDLEDMSGCNIYAADGDVNAESFDDDGLFVHALVGSNGKPANPVAAIKLARLNATTQQPGRPGEPAPIVEKILRAPALGLSLPPTGSDAQDAVRHFFATYAPIEPRGHLLAAPELELQTAAGPAVVVAGLRYLLVGTGDRQQWFERPAASADARDGSVAALAEVCTAARHHIELEYATTEAPP